MPPRRTSSPFGVTQQDIAESLSISRSTVAQALNPKHEKNLLPETVALVKRRAAEMNYYPKRFAQLLRQGRTYTIGAVFKLARFYAPHEQVRLLSHTVLNRGYQLVTVDRNWFAGKPEAEDKFILESALDGLMLCNLKMDELPRWLQILRERDFPMIGITSDVPCQMDTASWDIFSGYEALTRHHIEQGSRRLALLLASPAWVYSVDADVIFNRIEGFATAIRAAGGSLVAPFDFKARSSRPKATGRGGRKAVRKVAGDALVGEVICRDEADGFSGNVYRYGFDAVTRLIREDRLPDSLVCSNDEMAAGAITACIEHKVPIPQRVRISGADDSPFAAYCGIPITTVSPQLEALSQWATDTLIARIEKRTLKTPPQHRLFPAPLVVRRSTANVPVA